jgi:hypothetical protein
MARPGAVMAPEQKINERQRTGDVSHVSLDRILADVSVDCLSDWPVVFLVVKSWRNDVKDPLAPTLLTPMFTAVGHLVSELGFYACRKLR